MRIVESLWLIAPSGRTAPQSGATPAYRVLDGPGGPGSAWAGSGCSSTCTTLGTQPLLPRNATDQPEIAPRPWSRNAHAALEPARPRAMEPPLRLLAHAGKSCRPTPRALAEAWPARVRAARHRPSRRCSSFLLLPSRPRSSSCCLHLRDHDGSWSSNDRSQGAGSHDGAERSPGRQVRSAPAVYRPQHRRRRTTCSAMRADDGKPCWKRAGRERPNNITCRSRRRWTGATRSCSIKPKPISRRRLDAATVPYPGGQALNW